jgi:hypothetical protein
MNNHDPHSQKPSANPAQRGCAVATGSASETGDMTDDPAYQAWVESMAKHCRCDHDCPCAGVLAGGLCDNIQDDPHDDEETPSERYDRDVYGDEWHTPMSL